MLADLLLVIALAVVLSAAVWVYTAITRPRRGPWTDTTNHAPKGGAK